MTQYVLNYYPEFKCIAKKCKHTCCAGWEMLIDKESLDKYQSDLSPFAKTLKNGINFKKSKFKHDKHKRCTFLNQSGLCDLIINLGEESLCQVCRDHPRFRSFFSDRVEMGLGFSCEQATKIILSFKDKIELVQTSDNFANEQLSFIEQHVLSFREKALSIIQDRTSDINDRIKKLLTFCNTEFSTKDFNKILRCFIGFEKLDKSWNKRLNALKKYSFDINTEQNLSFYCEQFLVNSIYRHLAEAEDVMSARIRLLSLIFSWCIIKSIFENEIAKNGEFELICDIVRAFSTEIEYSQKNLNKLFNFTLNLKS